MTPLFPRCTDQNERPVPDVFALLDRPNNIEKVFFPRKSRKPVDPHAYVYDIPVTTDTTVGAQLFLHDPTYPTILFFHGNGEIVNDYDYISKYFEAIGTNLFVVDYRGYGWSKGSPSFRSLIEDAPAVMNFLEHELKQQGAIPTVYVMGRSIGGATAVRLAEKMKDDIAGLILESAYADPTSLLYLLRLELDGHASEVSDAISNQAIIARLTIPLLIIHGMEDRLIPVDHARTNFKASMAKLKSMKIIGDAGHNDLMIQTDEYFPAIQKFISDTGSKK